MENPTEQAFFPIVLAEDDPDDEQQIIKAFTTINKNLNITVFDNGKKALEYLLSVPSDQMPCLIILDLSLPEMNGREVLKKLCEVKRFKVIPKIILSNSNSNKDMQQCLADGAFAYKIKPPHFSELVSVASEMLDICAI